MLGVLLAFWGVDLILALDPGEVPRVAPVSVDGYALTFALVLSVVTGMLFGVVPAWQASRPELQNTLKDNTRGSTGDGQRHLARAGTGARRSVDLAGAAGRRRPAVPQPDDAHRSCRWASRRREC